eukprot:5360990-Amphidinium_carterae.1
MQFSFVVGQTRRVTNPNGQCLHCNMDMCKVSTVWMLGNFAMRMDGTDPSRPTTRRKKLSE